MYKDTKADGMLEVSNVEQLDFGSRNFWYRENCFLVSTESQSVPEKQTDNTLVLGWYGYSKNETNGLSNGFRQTPLRMNATTRRGRVWAAWRKGTFKHTRKDVREIPTKALRTWFLAPKHFRIKRAGKPPPWLRERTYKKFLPKRYVHPSFVLVSTLVSVEKQWTLLQ